MKEKIQEIETEIEEALWSLEVHDEIEKAYEAYRKAETKLEALAITTDDPAYADKQRVLAYCLMRQGNLLRQMGKPEAALALSEREIIAARASKDEIMLARSLMSRGTNQLVAGEVSEGLAALDEASEIFAGGESKDHRQGLGWYWILQGDLAHAGLIEKEPAELLEMAEKALEILEPIENWPGVARAYALKAEAHKQLGNEAEEVQAREEQEYYERKVEKEADEG